MQRHMRGVLAGGGRHRDQHGRGQQLGQHGTERGITTLGIAVCGRQACFDDRRLLIGGASENGK
jgi:hypothetical protein